MIRRNKYTLAYTMYTSDSDHLSWKYYGAKRVTERRRAFLSSFLSFIRHTGLSKSSTRQKTERNRKWQPGGECPSEIARERSLGISSWHGDFGCLNNCCNKNTTYTSATCASSWDFFSTGFRVTWNEFRLCSLTRPLSRTIRTIRTIRTNSHYPH